jgi:excisionase family DNA binding protein
MPYGASMTRRNVSEAQPVTAQYLTPADVAARLGISLRQVRRHIASGELPASRIGSSHLIRIRAEDVEALMRPVTRRA